MQINIVDAINRQLVDDAIDEFENKRRDYSHFHASEWDKCHRKIAYNYYYHRGFIQVEHESVRKSIQPGSQRIFGNGHFTHDRWRGYFEKSGALMGVWECMNYAAHEKVQRYGEDNLLGTLKPEVCSCGSANFLYREVGLFDEETLWGGHLDVVLDVQKFRAYHLRLLSKGKDEVAGIVQEDIEDKHLLIDIKTINPVYYKSLTGPQPDHNTQMQIYLYLTGLKFGKFIYENKWTQETKEYLVTRDDVLLNVKKAEALRLKRLVNHVNANGQRFLPVRGFSDPLNMECTSCKFRDHCWKETK